MQITELDNKLQLYYAQIEKSNQKSKYIKLYNHIYNFSNKLSKENHDNKNKTQIKIITVKKKN